MTEKAYEKALPANIEAEKAVLGAALLRRGAIDEVSAWLTPAHFHSERHTRIYTAMLSCAASGAPIDTRTLYEELRRREQLDAIDGGAYLGELIEAVPSSQGIADYARIVAQTAQRRRGLLIAGQLAGMFYDETGDVVATIAAAHALLDSIGAGEDDASTGAEFTAADLDQEELPPHLWAVPGLIPVGLTLLIGKPKMRKSWLALALSLAIATGGRALGTIPVDAGDVLYLALEDGKHRLQARQRKILSGAAAPRRLTYRTAAPRLDQGCIGVVESWLRRHEEARLVIIDVLAKVRPRSTGRGSMYDEDYAALEPLQQLAIRKRIAVLVVHHMNRSDAEDIFDQINGSNGVGGSADGLLGLQYERGQTDAVLRIGGRDVEDDSALALRWDNTTAQWILLGKAEEVKASSERQAILSLFREEKRPMGPKEVAELLDKLGEYGNIKQLMRRMSKEGDLQLSARGMYTLPSLTLLPVDGESDRSDRSDPGVDHFFQGNGTRQNGQSDRSDPNLHMKKLDHLDHLDHLSGFEASGPGEKGDPAPDHFDHLLDAAPSVVSLELDWPYLRALFAAGNEKAIRTHCAMRRADPEQVLRTLTPEDIP